jgi:hypothetical protein
MMLTPWLTERGPTGGRRVAAPALICSLMIGRFFFLGGIRSFAVCGFAGGGREPAGGGQIFATWLNDSSTGVSRPKIGHQDLELLRVRR